MRPCSTTQSLSNGVTLEYTHCGSLDIIPVLEVYYNPHSIDNLLSMSVVTSKYHVTMDSGAEDAIVVHLKKTKRLNSHVAAVCSINLIPLMISLCRRLKIRSQKMEQLINLKALLPATHFSPLLTPF